MRALIPPLVVLPLVLGLAQADPPASQPGYTSFYTGRITAIGNGTLELHVLRGHSGIVHPVLVDAQTQVVLLNGKAGTLSDLKTGQWVQVYWNPDAADPRQQRIVRIEPSMPSWAAQRLAELDKSASSLRVGMRFFLNGKGDQEQLHLLGPDHPLDYKEPCYAALSREEMGKVLKYLALEGFLAEALDETKADGRPAAPPPPYVTLTVGSFYQAFAANQDALKRLEGLQAVLPEPANRKMAGVLANVREKVGVPASQPAATDSRPETPRQAPDTSPD